MKTMRYRWEPHNVFKMVLIPGTHSHPFPFGERTSARSVEIQDFYIAAVPVTRALWLHVMGANTNPDVNRSLDVPVENVSWDQITQPGGFLDRINQSAVHASMLAQLTPRAGRFRLPSETEWEYAARGGPLWQDGFRFSGSNDIDTVAWYDRKHGDHTQPAARKAPNQLGICDMSGNVWEWCQDVFTLDIDNTPLDGSPFTGIGRSVFFAGVAFTIGPFTAPCQRDTR